MNPPTEAFETAIIRKIAWRILPLVIVAYCIAFVDRSNIAVAALTMSKDLGLSPFTYGLGAGIFFLGYFIFEIPSNLILERVGARLWIARIMFTWGIPVRSMRLRDGTGDLGRGPFSLGGRRGRVFPWRDPLFSPTGSPTATAAASSPFCSSPRQPQLRSPTLCPAPFLDWMNSWDSAAGNGCSS
jgi:MFS family permease